MLVSVSILRIFSVTGREIRKTSLWPSGPRVTKGLVSWPIRKLYGRRQPAFSFLIGWEAWGMLWPASRFPDCLGRSHDLITCRIAGQSDNFFTKQQSQRCWYMVLESISEKVLVDILDTKREWYLCIPNYNIFIQWKFSFWIKLFYIFLWANTKIRQQKMFIERPLQTILINQL